MTQSIRETLTALADLAGVPVSDLSDDDLDIIALRLVAECGSEPSFMDIGRIVDSVRWSLRVVP